MEAGSVECVKLLADEEEVKWNEKNMVGNTPLLTAMRENNTDLVKTLLKIPSVDINVKDRHGKCLLKLAAEKNNLQLVKIFGQILPVEESVCYLPELFKEECEGFVVDIEKGPGKKEIGIKWTGGVDNPPGNTDGVTVEEVCGQAADCGIQKDYQIVAINGQSVEDLHFGAVQDLMNAADNILTLEIKKGVPKSKSPPWTEAQVLAYFNRTRNLTSGSPVMQQNISGSQNKVQGGNIHNASVTYNMNVYKDSDQ